MMLHEVLAAEPSVIALIVACSEMRRTLQWPPSIPDVLKAIREQEVCWRYRLGCASATSEAHMEALSKLTNERAWLARPDEEKMAERNERLGRMEGLKRRLTGVVAERAKIENA
jgi:hypothetical protein